MFDDEDIMGDVLRTWPGVLLLSHLLACGGEGEVNNTPSGGSAGSASGGGAAQGGSGAAAGSGAATGSETAGSGAAGGNAGVGGGAGGGQNVGAGGQGGSGGGTSGELDAPCTWGNAQCNGGLYCDAGGCGAGTCQSVLNTAAQQPDYDPVCGCDGIHYFNPTIAQSRGAAISHPGVCNNAEQLACDKVSAPCGAGLSCSVEVNTVGMCAPTLTAGVCWGVPVACGAAQPMARGCLAPGACANKCALIRGQNPWYEDLTCQ